MVTGLNRKWIMEAEAGKKTLGNRGGSGPYRLLYPPGQGGYARFSGSDLVPGDLATSLGRDHS